MNPALFSLSLVLLVLAGGVVVLFNRLVRDRNLVRAGLSDIDVQLQRRHDLVPQLVEAVRAYASFERAVLDEVTEQRARALGARDVGDRDREESALADGLNRLFALAENYPQLKADQNFRQLMTELVQVEDHLQHARRYYNGAVRQYNTRVQSFPDLLVARIFRFRAAEFFSADIEARVPPVIGGLA